MDSTCNWSRIIGLDLSKATFKGCILYGEGFVQRKNFSGEMKQDESGYVLINNTIQNGDIVLMEAGSSTFNLARYLLKNSKAEDVAYRRKKGCPFNGNVAVAVANRMLRTGWTPAS